MDEQIELEKSEFKTKRFKELGFHPQKEIPANRLLPVRNLIFFDRLCNFNLFQPNIIHTVCTSIGQRVE